MDKCKIRLGYNVVPPPYTRNFMPPKPDLVYPSLDDFVDVSESVVKKPTIETNEPKTVKKDSVTKKTVNEEEQLQALVDRKKVIITEATIRRVLQLEYAKGVYCLPNEDKQVDGMSTHSAVYVIPSHTKKVFSNMRRIGKDFSSVITPLFTTMLVQAQVDMGKGSTMQSTPPTYTIQPRTSKPQKKQKTKKSKNKDTHKTQPSDHTNEALNKDNILVQSNDLPLSRVNILGTGEDKLKLKDLMELYTKLSYRVGLSAKVESYDEESLGEEDASKQVRKIVDIDADKELTLIDETTKEQRRLNDQDEIMFDVNADLQGEEVFVDKEAQNFQSVVEEVIEDINTAGINETDSTTAPITTTITINELTLAQVLVEIKTSKPKAKGIIMQEPSEAPTTTILIPSKVQGKGKARIKADYELAQRLQAEEQEQLTDAEKVKAFMEFLEKRRKFFATNRAEEKRNKPPTKAQQRSFMCNYLKTMDGWKPRALKTKSFAEI
uniref:Uncharacterized protein n=1 Tax=Tanacetum cinerariifolium TaxID=118510 RepID=A0A6L2J998_TANCI|nr:hypothetical protein [Tanacetum cinerariifolium]